MLDFIDNFFLLYVITKNKRRTDHENVKNDINLYSRNGFLCNLRLLSEADSDAQMTTRPLDVRIVRSDGVGPEEEDDGSPKLVAMVSGWCAWGQRTASMYWGW